MSNPKTFKCVFDVDILSVEPAEYFKGSTFFGITDGDDTQSVLLTKKQVKKLRKVLKKCLKDKGEAQ